MQPISAEEASQAGAHQAQILPFLEAGLEDGQRELETAEQSLEMSQLLKTCSISRCRWTGKGRGDVNSDLILLFSVDSLLTTHLPTLLRSHRE